MYIQESIDANKGNPKGIWKALKSLTKSQKSSEITELKREDGTVETDALAMSNMLNDFFANFNKNLMIILQPKQTNLILQRLNMSH